MSGGDRNGDFPVSSSNQDCTSLVFQTPLNSPNPDVANQLSIGLTLTLQLRTVANRVQVVALYGEEVAGSITAAELPALVRCMNDGVLFVAIVHEIRGGLILVNVMSRR